MISAGAIMIKDTLPAMAEEKMEELNTAYLGSALPEEVDREKVNTTLVEIREAWYNETARRPWCDKGRGQCPEMRFSGH